MLFSVAIALQGVAFDLPNGAGCLPTPENRFTKIAPRLYIEII